MGTRWRWGSLAKGKWDQQTGPISHIKPYMVPSSNGVVLGEELGPQQVSVCGGTLAGEDAVSPSLTGRGPAPEKWSQPTRLSFPGSSPSLLHPCLLAGRPLEAAKTGAIGIIWSVGVQQSLTLSSWSTHRSCNLITQTCRPVSCLPFHSKASISPADPLFPPHFMYNCAETQMGPKIQETMASTMALLDSSPSPSAPTYTLMLWSYAIY